MSIKKILVAIVVISIMAFSVSASVAIMWPPTELPYDHCHVLAVGVADYPGTEYDVPFDCCVNDANNFYASVYEYYYQEIVDVFLNLDPMTLLLNSQATESGIDAAFETTFADCGETDLAIFYFSGHSGYITDRIPIDESGGMDHVLVTYDMLPYTDDKLAAKMNEIDAKAKIVILDVCYAGEFRSELDVNNQVALMSTQCDEYSYPYIYHSLRWPYLLVHQQALSHYISEHPDINGDGLVSIEEVFGYASPRVTTDAANFGKSQHPLMVDNVPGEVYYRCT